MVTGIEGFVSDVRSMAVSEAKSELLKEGKKWEKEESSQRSVWDF